MKTTNPLAFLARWSVTFFLMDRAYGGPEEGGWWYTAGEPILPDDSENSEGEVSLADYHRVFVTERAARKYAHSLAEVEEEVNLGRPPMYSVLSEGKYRVMVLPERTPGPFPTYRPHYE